MSVNNNNKEYNCWLDYRKTEDSERLKEYQISLNKIAVVGDSSIINSIEAELNDGISAIIGDSPIISREPNSQTTLQIAKVGDIDFHDNIMEDWESLNEEGFVIKSLNEDDKDLIIITSKSDRGLLYGTFKFLRLLQMDEDIDNLNITENPANPLRIINHWDNMDGSIERGYAGKSIFYKDNYLTDNLDRLKDYARLLASIGINSVAINNVNVHQEETELIREKLGMVKTIADIFREYGLKVFLSVNYASPMEIGDLATADPLDEGVRNWWKGIVEGIYESIPDFGGFLVKADSEHRPGPYTYDRNHAQGANMLAEALEPYGGLLIWRCFVYNCQQDWRDLSIDRARAAYDNFMPLDGDFNDNVILQIKNGPMDFQVREPITPLFGKLKETNQILEFQITQEYTGQQRHLCYLIPQWKEVLDFDTYACGDDSPVKRVIDGSLISQKHNGFAAVVNVGDDKNWTGHTLAQSNLYGYGRLAWNPELTADDITEEWVRATFGNDPEVLETISEMLLGSWETYENYTSPLGIGWMVNPHHHYGPNVDGYEYSPWGTYHRADHFGIGVDRTVKNGTGYAGQYYPEVASKYESMEQCPEELLLFFHHVPYVYRLKSGKTLIQHIYDTHFKGVEQVEKLIDQWESIKNNIEEQSYNSVISRLQEQLEHSREWRDVINSYFYRKSGIADEYNREIY